MLKKRIIVLVVCCSILLGACSPTATATPLTQATIDAIKTSVVQTLAVSMPTVTPQPTFTVTPTITQTPLVTPTLMPPTATRMATVATCDNSFYLADVTIPDGTVMTPGQAFTKTWSIKNVGTCNWSTAYKMVFLSGDLMGGVSTPISAAINSGHADNISVKLIAPTTKGTYTGNWILQNAAGNTFGRSVTVVISVSTSLTATPTGTITPTPDVLATANALSTNNAAATYFAQTSMANANATATQAAIDASATASAIAAATATTPPP